ncbi:Imm47 family immunity protein [Paenibacillus sp. TH7-28]
MTNFQNLMNSIWYGEIPVDTCAVRASTEQEVLLHLIELFKLGDFSQKPLLIQLMNHTEDRAVLNLCIRVFCSIATHEDLRDPDHLRFLASVPADMVHTFASAAVTSLSLEAVPYLLALLEDWGEVSETSMVLREAIDAFIEYEEPMGLGASIEEIGHYYWKYCYARDTGKYYFNQELAFPGNLTKKLIERVLIAANGQQQLEMQLIPSLLSIWSGRKVPGEYHTVITEQNYKDFIDYVRELSRGDWKAGEKYFYGHKL